MIDLQDKNHSPVLEEIGEYVGNPVFMQFCSEIKNTYKCDGKIEYSSYVPYIQGKGMLQF